MGYCIEVVGKEGQGATLTWPEEFVIVAEK